MGCTGRGDGRGEPTFFNDYKSAAVHYSHSSHCNKSMRGIKAVTVQLNPRPHTLTMEARPEVENLSGAWRSQPARSHCAGAMI